MRYSARQLAHLAAVVDTGSLSLAAAQLGVTQPALSKSISQLEQRVGALLIKRGKSGSVPTTLGTMLAAQGRSIISATHRAEIQVEDWNRAAIGNLVIGAAPTMAAYFLPEMIAKFVSTRPHVTMRVEVSSLAGLLETLLANRMDMYIGVTRPSRLLQGLNAVPIYADILSVFARDHHPIFDRDQLVPADLAKYRWTTPLPDSFFRGIIDVSLSNAGVPAIDVALETFSFDLQSRLLQQTDFLSMLPQKFADQRSGLTRVQGVEDYLPGREYTVSALTVGDLDASPLAHSFVDLLLREESSFTKTIQDLQ